GGAVVPASRDHRGGAGLAPGHERSGVVRRGAARRAARRATARAVPRPVEPGDPRPLPGSRRRTAHARRGGRGRGARGAEEPRAARARRGVVARAVARERGVVRALLSRVRTSRRHRGSAAAPGTHLLRPLAAVFPLVLLTLWGRDPLVP